MALPDCTEEELQALYEWVDSVPLSRPKKSIARDFADGVLMAELVHHYFPKLVELHNYSAAHNSVQKTYNWNTLNQKVFRRMNFSLSREQYESVANADAGAIERVLKHVRARMARFQESGGLPHAAAARPAGAGAGSSQPASPAHYAAARGGGGPAAAAAEFGGQQGADGAAESIAALRIAAEVPGKLLAAAAAGGGMAAGASVPFPTLSEALSASLADKEQQLLELRETNELLETKISKLEQLVRLKDAKIQALLGKLQAASAAAAGQAQGQQQGAAAGGEALGGAPAAAAASSCL